MASWREVIDAAPDFAERVQTVFDAHLHKTVATLRRDGSPRISGNEAHFRDGELWLGMMPTSLKVADLMRDGRLALHSATVDPEMQDGDAKVSGHAVRITDAAEVTAAIPENMPPDEAAVFRVEIADVVLTRVGDPADHLVIESWTPDRGYRSIQRD